MLRNLARYTFITLSGIYVLTEWLWSRWTRKIDSCDICGSSENLKLWPDGGTGALCESCEATQ